MKLLTHPAVTALGFTSLYLLSITGQLVSGRHDILYHWSGTASALFVPVLLNFGAFWLVLTLLFSLARKPGRLGIAIWSGLTLPLPWVLSKNWPILTGRPTPPQLSAIIFSLTILAFLFLMIGWRSSLQSAFAHAQIFIATLLGFVAISSLFVLGQLFWFTWKARTLNIALQLHQPQQQTTSSAPKTRVVWILLDELSYQQVYERRFPGLQLPSFDRLASEATLFTHTVPAGRMTEDVIPSLFTGEPVDSIKASSDGHQLYLHNRNSNVWEKFNQHQTVFQDALNAGYSTAVAGWYNPYCRILPQVLDKCFWAFNLASIGGMSPAQSLAENSMERIRYAITSVLSVSDQLRRIPLYDAHNARLHESDYKGISTAADRLLEDPTATFIFLHMPIPHPGGIYDRHTGKFATTHSTYIDNLALADRYLDHVRTVLEQNGSWDSSVVIVMGDHSWRTNFMWEPKPSWTPEERIASHGGQFDDRPAYIVKLPHQNQPARIDFPYAAIHTRALLDAIIDNQIQSPDGLSAWAQKQGEIDKSIPIASIR